MLTSLELAAVTTVVATILGTMIALALVRHEFRGRRAANLLIVIPMTSPEVVIGAALLSMFVYFQVSTGFLTLAIAHIMFSISFVVVVVRSRLIGFDRRLEEAARDLGATPATTFRTVTLPLHRAGPDRRGAARVRALARRLRDLELQLRHDGDLPALHLRRRPARHPGRRSTSSRRCCSRSRSSRWSFTVVAAAPGREDGRRSGPTRRTATGGLTSRRDPVSTAGSAA